MISKVGDVSICATACAAMAASQNTRVCKPSGNFNYNVRKHASQQWKTKR